MAMLTVFTVLLSVSPQLCYSTALNMFLKEAAVCDVKGRLNHNCSSEVAPSNTLFDCVSSCADDESCLGASVDHQGKCFNHKACKHFGECDEEDKKHAYYAKYCVNGKWIDATKKCYCNSKWITGPRCQSYYKSCEHANDVIRLSLGFYQIPIDPEQNGNSFTMNCNFKLDRKSLLMSSQGKMETNRTWDEYVAGFFVDEKNFWTGLDKWHRLCHAGCEVWFRLMKQNVFNQDVWHDYKNFVVSGEEDDFQVTYGSSKSHGGWQRPQGSDFGDCLAGLQNTPFSTWDRDNDQETGDNCAGTRGRGWWFSGCTNPCNLLGWGPDLWSTTPADQHMAITGIDLLAIRENIDRIEIYIPIWSN